MITTQVEWKQTWLNNCIKVEYAEMDNGICKEGVVYLRNGPILELEGTMSLNVIKTVMILNGIQEAKSNDHMVNIRINDKPYLTPITQSDIDKIRSRNAFMTPEPPYPPRYVHVRIGQQNTTDYSWRESNETTKNSIQNKGAIRFKPTISKNEYGDRIATIATIQGPQTVSTSEYHRGIDISIAYIMARKGVFIRCTDDRTMVFPGDSWKAGSSSSVDEEIPEIIEMIFAGVGY